MYLYFVSYIAMQGEKKMTDKMFEKIMRQTFNDVEYLSQKKGVEYTGRTHNRMCNFVEAALENNTTPELALWGMYIKHFVSVKLHVNGTVPLTITQLTEKVQDSIVYLLLILANEVEKKQNEAMESI